MNSSNDAKKRDKHGGHAGHGFWAMVACCAPMIVILALFALKII